MYARQRTTGMRRIQFKIPKEKVGWELIDVGGQGSERVKWESVFKESLRGVIYFAALDEYNLMSAEREEMTKMQLSLSVFQEMLSVPPDKGTCLILFLNKVDLFKNKIKNRKHFLEFKKCFPDYKGTQDTDEACEYIRDLFTAKFIQTGREDALHSHITCALDTEAMKSVFIAVRGHLLYDRLKDLGQI